MYNNKLLQLRESYDEKQNLQLFEMLYISSASEVNNAMHSIKYLFDLGRGITFKVVKFQHI